MALVQIDLATLNMSNVPESFPGGHWESSASDVIAPAFALGIYEGNFLNWGGAVVSTTNFFTSQPYAGYTTNFGAVIDAGTLNTFRGDVYQGYSTNFGAEFNNSSELDPRDIDSVIEYPKDQFIYYKVKGYNPITQTYETWVEKEDITSRPELFDSGRHPPTIERDVNKLAPSGNALVNITIVARWIQ